MKLIVFCWVAIAVPANVKEAVELANNTCPADEAALPPPPPAIEDEANVVECKDGFETCL